MVLLLTKKSLCTILIVETLGGVEMDNDNDVIRCSYCNGKDIFYDALVRINRPFDKIEESDILPSDNYFCGSCQQECSVIKSKQ